MLQTFANVTDVCQRTLVRCVDCVFDEACTSLSLSPSPHPISVISALDMEAMVNTVKGWQENPIKFARSHGVSLSPEAEKTNSEKGVHILIVEGFLIYNHK